MTDKINTKQVLVMAKYLNMRKGKMVAQGSHASMGAVLNTGKVVTVLDGKLGEPDEPGERFFMIPMSDETEAWLTGSFKKVCLGIDNEADLVKLYNDAKDLGLNASLITDSGLTEFSGVPTITGVGIGPNCDDRIDILTGKESPLVKAGKLTLL